MAQRGAPEGNQNAREGRRWRDALRRALSRAGKDIDLGLDKCADKLVAAALLGKPWALEHIAERFDGKAVNHIQATVEHTVNTGDAASLKDRLRPTAETSERSVQ